MALGDKVIVTCAVTGAVTTKKQCAAIPYTAVEIGEECRRAYEAGATVVHVHGRSDDGQPSYDPAVFAAYKREIEARSPGHHQLLDGRGRARPKSSASTTCLQTKPQHRRL